MMRVAVLSILLLAIFGERTCAQQEKIHWMSLNEAWQKNTENDKRHKPKKIFIDVYTDWCGWCKKMDATTFTDDSVVNYMNENFYPVKFNAETHDTIVYKGVNYYYTPDYRANEIAAVMLNGKMGYPTSVYMDEKNDLIAPVQGYLTKEQLLQVLRYFATDQYKTMKWEDFMKTVR